MSEQEIDGLKSDFKSHQEIIDYNGVDPAIVEIVRGLNSLPYVNTRLSCHGHISNSLSIGVSADPGYCFLSDGYISFDVDQNNPQSTGFINLIEELISGYPFAKLYRQGESGFVLNFDSLDLVESDSISENDSAKDKLKKEKQIEIQKAQARLTEFEHLWKEFGDLVNRELAKNNNEQGIV